MLSAGSAPSVPAAKLVMAHDPASLIEPPARVTLAGNGWGVAAIVVGAVSGLAVGGECYAPLEPKDRLTALPLSWRVGGQGAM